MIRQRNMASQCYRNELLQIICAILCFFFMIELLYFSYAVTAFADDNEITNTERENTEIENEKATNEEVIVEDNCGIFEISSEHALLESQSNTLWNDVEYPINSAANNENEIKEELIEENQIVEVLDVPYEEKTEKMQKENPLQRPTEEGYSERSQVEYSILEDSSTLGTLQEVGEYIIPNDTLGVPDSLTNNEVIQGEQGETITKPGPLNYDASDYSGNLEKGEIAEPNSTDNIGEESTDHTLQETRDHIPGLKDTRLLAATLPTASPISTYDDQQILHIHATGFSESADQVVVSIVDSAENSVADVNLNRSSEFEADWKAPNTEEQYSVLLKDILDRDKNSILSQWKCSILQDSVLPTTSTETYMDWVERPDMPNGVYIFKFGEIGYEYLLASEIELTKKPIWRYLLASVSYLPDQTQLENMSVAQWVVNNYGTARCIQNAVSGGFLSADIVSRKGSFAGYYDDSYVSFNDGILYRDVGNGVGLCYFQNNSSTYSTAEAQSATRLTPLRWECITVTKTVRDYELVCEPVTSTGFVPVSVSLTVNGNIADRSQKFTFVAEVDDEVFEEFELSHNTSYLIQNIPIGATVTIRENQLVYAAVSRIGETTGGFDITFRAEGNEPISVCFVNTLQGNINTGIQYTLTIEPDKNMTLACLIIVGLRFVVPIPLRNHIMNKQHRRNKS